MKVRCKDNGMNICFLATFFPCITSFNLLLSSFVASVQTLGCRRSSSHSRILIEGKLNQILLLEFNTSICVLSFLYKLLVFGAASHSMIWCQGKSNQILLLEFKTPDS